jgi:hypothetical protein
LNSDKIWTIWKKPKFNSEKIFFQIFPLFNLPFFHIFPNLIAIQLTFLPYFPNLINIRLSFLPYFLYLHSCLLWKGNITNGCTKDCWTMMTSSIFVLRLFFSTYTAPFKNRFRFLSISIQVWLVFYTGRGAIVNIFYLF